MESTLVQILFAASAVIAAIAAYGTKVAPRLLSVATAVCLAAAAFFLQASNFIGK